jgi:ATP-dependent protease HslVU (ClpYQ) peptidase subunit
MKPNLPILRNIDIAGFKAIDGETCRDILPSEKRAVNSKAHISRMLCFLAIAAFLAGNCGATTVVVVRQDDFILIGVDGLVTAMNPTSGTGEFRACKIMQYGPYFFVLTGTFAQGGTEGFNAYRIVRNIAKDTDGAVNIADRFTKIVLRPYSKMLRMFQKDQPLIFDKYCRQRECMQLLIADSSSGSPVYAVREFHVTLRHNRPKVESLPKQDCPGACTLPASIVVLGDNIEATKVLNETPSFWLNHTLFTGIEDLIKAEMIAHPDEVGGQVSILIIKKMEHSGPPDIREDGLISRLTPTRSTNSSKAVIRTLTSYVIICVIVRKCYSEGVLQVVVNKAERWQSPVECT